MLFGALRATNRAFWCFPSCQKSRSRSCFLVLSLVHNIVLFGALPRAKNRALDRASWCPPSCQKSCFLVPSVPQIVLFGSFWCFPSCQNPRSRSCFLVLSLVHNIVLFGALPRAKNRALDRAFWCSPSCQKSCFLVPSVPQIVLFGAFPRAKNRALDCAHC